MGRLKSGLVALLVSLGLQACADDGMVAINSAAPVVLSYDVGADTLTRPGGAFALVFFTSYCTGCAEQMRIIDEIGAVAGFEFIGVIGDAYELEDALHVVREKGVKFATIYDGEDVEYLSDVVGGIYGVPATYVFGRDGRLVKKFLGPTPKGELQNAIKLAL